MTFRAIVMLAIDQDRPRQLLLSPDFHSKGVAYRFILEPSKLPSAVKVLNPNSALLFGDLGRSEVSKVLAHLCRHNPKLPVILANRKLAGKDYSNSFRHGVVGVVDLNADASKIVAEAIGILTQLSTRTGRIDESGNAVDLRNFLAYLADARRTGVLSIRTESGSASRHSIIDGTFQGTGQNDTPGSTLETLLAIDPTGWTFEENFLAQRPASAVHSTPTPIPSNGLFADEEAESALGEFPDKRILDLPFDEPAPKILLIDDNEAIVEMFSIIFRKFGFRICSALDGVSGLAAAFAEEPDLIFMDLNMPKLDGWGVLRQLHTDYRSREIPVAILSAHDDYRESLKAIGAGAEAYIPKGSKIDVLVYNAKLLLEPRRSACRRLAHAISSIELPLGKLGSQWLISHIIARNHTGALEARDEWARYTLRFQGGRLLSARSQVGSHSAHGPRALQAFVASNAGQASWSPGVSHGPVEFTESISELLKQVRKELNELAVGSIDSSAVQATNIVVEPKLYKVYRQLGPPDLQECARLLCEERIAPREMMAQEHRSPLEIEATIRDLVRRGVVVLKRY